MGLRRHTLGDDPHVLYRHLQPAPRWRWKCWAPPRACARSPFCPPSRGSERAAAGRVAAVTLRRRRARTRPASARARVSATTAATGWGSVCARAAVCARQLRVCVCAREFCARPLRCSPAAAALPLARRCRSLYSRRRRPIVCARVRARAWPSRRQKSEWDAREGATHGAWVSEIERESVRAPPPPPSQCVCVCVRRRSDYSPAGRPQLRARIDNNNNNSNINNNYNILYYIYFFFEIPMSNILWFYIIVQWSVVINFFFRSTSLSSTVHIEDDRLRHCHHLHGMRWQYRVDINTSAVVPCRRPRSFDRRPTTANRIRLGTPSSSSSLPPLLHRSSSRRLLRHHVRLGVRSTCDDNGLLQPRRVTAL